MANLDTKYLDYDGLIKFLSNLQGYIASRISEINGKNLHLNPSDPSDPSGTNNPTITSQINDLWVNIGTTNEDLSSLISNYNSHKHSVTAEGEIKSTFAGDKITHNHTFTGNQNATSNEGLTISYSNGKLSITSAHIHTLTPTGTISDKSLTPTGTVTSIFEGKEMSTGEPNSKK